MASKGFTSVRATRFYAARLLNASSVGSHSILDLLVLRQEQKVSFGCVVEKKLGVVAFLEFLVLMSR